MGTQGLSLSPMAPHFFKIIHSHIIQHTKLRIPKKFVSEYGQDLKEKDHVLLEVPSGGVWKVKIITSNADVWLQNGWKEFADHHSIGLWHFLVFRYEGNSYFHVVIFNKSVSEIEYPSSGANQISANQNRREIDTQKASPLEAAKAFKSENPFFIITMQTSYVAGCLSVPLKFADRYFTREYDSLYVTLRVLDGRSWPVKCMFSAFNAKLSGGWKMFALDNHLIVGDVCVFELINSSKNLLNVVIFRAAKDANMFHGKFKVGRKSFEIDEDKAEKMEDFPSGQTRDRSPAQYQIRSYKKIRINSTREKSDLIEICRVPKIETRAKDACPMKHIKSEEDVSFHSIEAEGKRKATMNNKDRSLQSARAFTSKKPFFKVTMQPSYVDGGGLLNLPRLFACKYFTKEHNKINVTLHVSNGRSWSVNCTIYTSNAKFNAGWRTFVQDNHLALGDVCVFELINGVENSLIVFIFRALKLEHC